LGPLAYVTEAERQAVLSLPFGCFKPAVQRLEKQIKEMEKRKRQKESELKRIHRFSAPNELKAH
jgi:hypothetical protein